MDLRFASLVYIVTVVGRIIISQRWIWQVLFFCVTKTFLFIAFLAFGFSVFAVISRIIFVLDSIFAAFYVIGKIIFSRWRVWRWWVWLRVLCYVQFCFLLWQLRWSCQWHEFWSFCSDRNRVQLWCFYVVCVCTNRSQVQRWSTHWNILAPKVLISPPIFKTSFTAIVLVWPCWTHSDRCCSAKNTIWRWPMGSIYRPSNPGSGGTEDTKFIRCVDGREPQIHELWCLGLDNMTREVHPTAQVEVIAETVGEFMTNYLADKGRRISIIRQLSINGCVKILGITNFSRGSGL